MNCDWQADSTDSRIKRCRRPDCGKRVVTDHPPEMILSECKSRDVDRRPPQCAHLGDLLRSVGCQTCGGSITLDVFACAKFGEATKEKRAPDVGGCCKGCAMFDAAEPAQTRNLIYHICPFAASNVWRKNVRQLVKRIKLFNGKRIVAIATGEGIAPAAEVRAEFGDCGIRFIEAPNSMRLRERATFEILMDAVASMDPSEATFYAHAKGGATIGDATGVMYWRNLMYHALLDNFERVRKALGEAPIVGTHRMTCHVCYPDHLASSDWHFSGAFFWFRNADVFSRDWRGALTPSGWGVEAWPGRMFSIQESHCLAMENPQNAYDPATYAEADRIADDGGPGESVALKLEIGGGDKPRGDGWLNVDKCEGADVRLDFDAEDFRLPFADDSVLSICSSHCLEHIRELRRLLREVVRVCRPGALVEIRVPHWNSSMAMCHDHKQTIAEPQVDHWCNSAVDYWLGGMAKRLKLMMTDYVPSGNFEEAKTLHPGWTDNQVMRFVPDACHEICFVMHIVEVA